MGCRQSSERIGLAPQRLHGAGGVPLSVWSLLPDVAFTGISADQAAGTALTDPRMDIFPGAVAFVDISGFTKFIESSGNIEECTITINLLLSFIVRFAYHCEGDVIKFAGDAVLILFSAGPLALHAALAYRAVCFATELLDLLDDFNTTNLGVHIGVGVGDVSGLHVGSADRWEYVVAGPVLSQIHCVNLAPRSQVAVSAAVWRCVEHDAMGTPVGEDGAVLVHRLVVPRNLQVLTHRDTFSAESGRACHISKDVASRAEKYVAPGVLSLLRDGMGEFLCEFRRVTVVFINLDKVEVGHERFLGRLNEIVNVILRHLKHFEGTLRQLIIDDKGTVAILCFGLRPAHPDDPLRGVQASLCIQKELKDRNLGVQASFGVTTGRAYCAFVGHHTRAEYACVGSSVNISARLMGLAAGRILVDDTTHEECTPTISFSPPELVRLKNIDTPRTVYYVEEGNTDLAQSREVLAPSVQRMWGREPEFERVREWVMTTFSTGTGGMAIIEADSGMGKSLMLRRICEQMEGVDVVTLLPSAVQSINPYNICTELFMQLLNIRVDSNDQSVKSYAAQMTQLFSHLRQEVHTMGPEAIDRLPLLNDAFLFPERIPDNQFTASLTGLSRTVATRTLLVNLLEQITAARPLLLVVDNLQCLDTSSWQLLVDVANMVCNVVVLAAASPSVRKRLPDYTRVVGEENVCHVTLNRLSSNSIGNIVCEHLGVQSLSSDLDRLVTRAAGGNASFAIEIIKLFQLRGELVIESNVASLRQSATRTLPHTGSGLTLISAKSEEDLTATLGHAPSRLNLRRNSGGRRYSMKQQDGNPEILNAALGSVLAGNMDLLSVEEQTTLKVAAVIGQRFHVDCLTSVLPSPPQAASAGSASKQASLALTRINAHLDKFVSHGLIERMQGGRYSFCSALMHEFVYHSIPIATRRKYHLAAADWIKSHPMYAAVNRWAPADGVGPETPLPPSPMGSNSSLPTITMATPPRPRGLVASLLSPARATNSPSRNSIVSPAPVNLQHSAAVLAMLVYHYLQAGSLQHALTTTEELGQMAFRANGYSEAIRAYRKALAIDDDLAALTNNPNNNNEMGMMTGSGGTLHPDTNRQALDMSGPFGNASPIASPAAVGRGVSAVTDPVDRPVRPRRMSLDGAVSPSHAPRRPSQAVQPSLSVAGEASSPYRNPSAQVLLRTEHLPLPVAGMCSAHTMKRGVWQSRIGLSYLELGRHHKAQMWLHRALVNLGVAIPEASGDTLSTALTALIGVSQDESLLAAARTIMYVEGPAVSAGRTNASGTGSGAVNGSRPPDRVDSSGSLNATQTFMAGAPAAGNPISVTLPGTATISSMVRSPASATPATTSRSHGRTDLMQLETDMEVETVSVNTPAVSPNPARSHAVAPGSNEPRPAFTHFNMGPSSVSVRSAAEEDGASAAGGNATLPVNRSWISAESRPAVTTVGSFVSTISRSTHSHITPTTDAWNRAKSMFNVAQNAVDLTNVDLTRLSEIVRVVWPLMRYEYLCDQRLRTLYWIGVLRLLQQLLGTTVDTYVAQTNVYISQILDSYGHPEFAAQFASKAAESIDSAQPCVPRIEVLLSYCSMSRARWDDCMLPTDAATVGSPAVAGPGSTVALQASATRYLLRGMLQLALQDATESVSQASLVHDLQIENTGRALAAACLLHLGRFRDCALRLAELGNLEELRWNRAVQALAFGCRSALAVSQGRRTQALGTIIRALEVCAGASIVHAHWVPAFALVSMAAAKLLLAPDLNGASPLVRGRSVGPASASASRTHMGGSDNNVSVPPANASTDGELPGMVSTNDASISASQRQTPLRASSRGLSAAPLAGLLGSGPVDDVAHEHFVAKVQVLVDKMTVWSEVLSILKPWTFLLKGALTASMDDGITDWTAGAEIAREQNMMFAEACNRQFLGRSHSASAANNLMAAQTAFQQCGTTISHNRWMVI